MLSFSPEAKKEGNDILLLSPHNVDWLTTKSLYGDLDDKSFLKNTQPLQDLSWQPLIFQPKRIEGLFSGVDEVTTTILSQETIKEPLKDSFSTDYGYNKIVKRIGNSKKPSILKIGSTIDIKVPKTKLPSITFSMGFFNSASINNMPVDAESSVKLKSARNLDFEEGKSEKCCNCKKSRCLKLYCDCFANKTFCKGCNCIDCHNIRLYEDEVLEAREKVGAKRHLYELNGINIGCNCSKGCTRKYCECFKKDKMCGSGCNCIGCKNKVKAHKKNAKSITRK